MTTEKELAFRMGAMRAAGLIPDPAVADDAVWRGLYNGNLSVRLAYDQDKHGKRAPAIPEQTLIKSFRRDDDIDIKPYTPGQDTPKEATITPKPKPTLPPEPDKVKQPMDRKLLIATARGHAHYVNDDYFAWLLNELADQLEKDTPINLAED